MIRVRCNIFKIFAISIFILFIIFLLVVLITPALYIRVGSLVEIFINNREVAFALIFSLITSVISTLLAAIVALPTGYVLARFDFPGKRVFDIIVDLPIILPPLVLGLSLLVLLGPVAGDYLGSIGLRFVYSPSGVVIAQFMVATPFAIRSFKTAFAGVDPVLEKAAMTLGDGYFRVFRKVTLPLARNGIIAGLTLAWARAIGEFGATVMLAGATRFKTETLPIAIFLNISTGDINVAISIGLIMIIFAALILAFLKIFDQNRFNYKGLN